MGGLVSGRVAGMMAVVMATGALLTGCMAGPPDPTQPPAPTRSPVAQPSASPPPSTPAPEPVIDIDPVVTRIVVRPEHLDLVNSAGVVVVELSYDAEGEVFASALEAVLGGPPDIEERPGGHEWWPSTRYIWPGVTVSDDHEREGVATDMNVNITFTHPVVGNGISVTTVQGFRPGDDLHAFSEDLGEEWHSGGANVFPAETGPDVGPRGYDDWSGEYWRHANANAVSVSEWGAGEDPSVTSVIFAPWNFGIGHV